MFDDMADANAYTNRHARSVVLYTRSGKRPTVDMHTIELNRLAHYRSQLAEGIV